MYILIILSTLTLVCSSYLEAESNYYKPKLERNNKLNKGVWLRNNEDRNNFGHFIFKANSLEGGVLTNNFDAFGDNLVQDSSFFSSYAGRNKRSSKTGKQDKQENPKRSVNTCKDDKCEKSDEYINKSKFISKLRPSSLFNDYPYEVAILLANNNKKHYKFEENKTDLVKENNQNSSLHFNITKAEVQLNTSENYAKNDNILPKRSMQSQFETELVKKIDYIEIINGTENENFANKNDYTVQPVVTYKKTHKNKPLTENALVKVLSMLAKTFKKIMRHHHVIKDMHDKLHNLNNEFTSTAKSFNKKLKEFDQKFLQITKLNDKLKLIEEKLNKKENIYTTKEKEISRNLLKFENQQKKFLLQQKSFYNIQRLMLDQNEKINTKQNLIARTQSEISHRQNNIARILKKENQLLTEGKLHNKLNTAIAKPQIKTKEPVTEKVSTTENVKIDLLSIHTTPIEKIDHDKLLLSEKDKQAVDDLIYKFYFNNTFIDDLMKTKVLVDSENKYVRGTKSKRNGLENNTILLPVKGSNRQKRWVSHWNMKSKHHKKTRKITAETAIISPTEKSILKNDAFLSMAANFCTAIGQNTTEQILNWCVEKALRRLRYMDSNLPVQPLTSTQKLDIQSNTARNKLVIETSSIGKLSTVTETNSMDKMTNTISSMFFPDNEELESNLRQYEIKPDTEGNVYFDGSLHASDIIGSDSEGFSDVMPGLDSNSRVDLDPRTLDLQARRRAIVRSINDNILKTRMV